MKELKEKCGVFGVYGSGFEAARLTHPGLWALQHRGQESSGIVSSDGEEIRFHKGSGLVAQVYNEDDLDNLKGHLAIGHNRYSTSKGSSSEHNQPVVRSLNSGKLVAVAHNGNLPSTRLLEEHLTNKGVTTESLNDTEMMTETIRTSLNYGATLEESIKDNFPLFTGAFSMLVMTEDKIAAVRDSRGVRPLSLGRLNGGYIFSSETCSLDVISAEYERDINPGEMVVVDESGVRSYELANESVSNLDLFEFIYFARPDSLLYNKRVNIVRKNLGTQLFRECPAYGDVVIPIPDSGIPAGLGYYMESGIPFDHGLIKNRYIHRTFIRPEQHLREKDVEMKLNPLVESLEGKDVIVIDDSIVRGTTSRKIVEMLRRNGAKRVHMRISSSPIRFPDFYGIDTPKQKDLVAFGRTVEEINSEMVGADSLYFISYEGMIEATGLPEELFTTSCFTGKYPIDIGERAQEIVYPQRELSPV